jgi:starch-binding outer membrane protein, SusD/RagB family
MKAKKYYFRKINAFLIALLALVTACQDLGEDPKSFGSPSNFYNEPKQVEAVYAGAMNALWGSWYGYGWAMRASFQHTDSQDGGNLNISQNHAADLWAAHYRAITNVNFALAAIKKGNLGGLSQGEIDVLVGQGKFLRAYNYFMLVRMFGDLPLPTEDMEEPFNTLLPRTPVAEVYALIVSDLTEAVQKLPTSWPEAQRGRPTSDVAKGLLAKAHLTMATAPLNDVSNYAKAATLAKEIIDDGRYSLVQDIDEVFTAESEFGPEIMWSFISNYADQATSPQIWTSFRGWGDISVDTEWLDKYPEQPRKYAYFEIFNSDGVSFKDLGLLAGVKKYQYDPEEDFDAGRSTINIPILRYADILLIFAEADNMANGGPTQEAVDAVNLIIDRANDYVDNPAHPKLTTSMSAEAFDTAVIEERNYELSFEYDRWFDLVRKRILGEKSRDAFKPNFSEDDYLFPIPENDLRLNSMLEQNPGY